MQTTFETVIKTKKLSRTYQSYIKPEGLINSIKGLWDRKYNYKTALENVSLEIQSGQIIGLVGANGAGKTTLIKILSGLIVPSSGEVEVLSYKPWERKYAFLKQISVLLGQKNQLWWDIAPMDSFVLLANIYDLQVEQTKNKVIELAEMLDCKHVLQTQLRRLSLGERMKMEIIGSLLHDPKILFLDEPTIGLDIVAQSKIRDFLSNYVKTRGTTVLLTSHYMDDIAKLSDRLLLISKGHLVYDGTVSAFANKAEDSKQIFVRFSESLNADFHYKNIHLAKTQREFQFELTNHELSEFMPLITKVGSIEDLKIEEVDFEHVIHKFLQKESSFR